MKKSLADNYNRILFSMAISLLLSINVTGQEKHSQDKWNIKFGYAKYGISQWITTTTSKKQIQTNNYRIELNYYLANNLEVGIYAGYSKFNLFLIQDTVLNSKRCHTPFYGINCNFHILPYIIQHDTKFDLYLAGKFGGYYFFSPSDYHMHGARIEYAIGAGLSYHIIKHFGLYMEYCKGNYYFQNDLKLRYGLTFDF